MTVETEEKRIFTLHADVVDTLLALEEGDINEERAIEQLTLACSHFLNHKQGDKTNDNDS